MKAMSTFLLLSLSIMLAACGNQSSSQSATNQFENFINSKNGVEFKEPSIVSTAQIASQQQYSYAGFETSEILLSLDLDGTFHLRATIPESLNTNESELEGTRGRWSLDERNQLILSDNNGAVLAQAYSSFNQEASDSFTITFTESINLDTYQVTVNQNVQQGFTNYTSYATSVLTLNGMTTVSR